METFILYQYVVLPIITNESIAQLPQAIHVLYRHHLPPHKNETIVVLFAKMYVVQDFSKGHTRLELKKSRTFKTNFVKIFRFIWLYFGPFG